MPDAYDWNNVVSFLGGFGQKRGEIAAANQADKEYKLKTVQTMFEMAEGQRAQAAASAEAAEDTSLSTDARARHRAQAEKSLQEGSRIYDGASELFGMIDEKPKTGKKENPAMQFLKFVNPFTRRGPEAGEFEARLQELMVGLGGKGFPAGGGGGAGGGTDVGGGLGKLPTSGQGAPTPGSPDIAGLIGAMPGGAAEERLATTGQILAQERGEPLRGTEMIPGTIFPTETALGLPQPDFSAEGATLAAAPQFPYIELGRYAPQFGAMPSDQYWNGVALEVKDALTGLQAIQARTPNITETLDDLANDPEAWRLYITAQTGSANHPQLESDDLAKGLAFIFPDLRADRPDAGASLVRQFESDLRRMTVNNPEALHGPFKDWPIEVQKSAAKVHAFYTVASDTPEVQSGKLALDAWMTDPGVRTKQQKLNIDAWLNARKWGMGGGAGGTAGAAVSYSGRSVMDPETGQMVVGKMNNRTGDIEVVKDATTGKPFFTENADISRWQAQTPITVYPDEASVERGITEPYDVYPLLPWEVISSIDNLKITRARLRSLMELPMFDYPPGARANIEQYLRDNPDVGGPESPEYQRKQEREREDQVIRDRNPFLFPR